MKVTRSRTHHVSMGNYEWFEFGASVESDIDRIDPDSIHRMETALDLLLQTDLDEAREVTGLDKSYVNIYQKDI